MTDADLAQLKRDVQILKDTEAVKKVKHAYFRCIDTANLDELKTLLHPKVHAKLVGGTYAIEFNDRDDYIEMVANSFHSEFVGMHHGHHPEIEILSETEATGTWYLQDIAMDFRRKARGDRRAARVAPFRHLPRGPSGISGHMRGEATRSDSYAALAKRVNMAVDRSHLI